MMQRTLRQSTRLLLTCMVLPLAVVATACGEDFDEPNQAAVIHAVGDLSPVSGADAGDAGVADGGDASTGGTAGFTAQIGREGDGLLIPYLISDREGDDQDIRVEICQWTGTEAVDCGFPVQGPEGDGTNFVPTTPGGTRILHLFHWGDVCGRFVETSSKRTRLEVPDLTQPLVARISVVGADAEPVRSAPFELADTGFDQVPECP